MKTTKITRMCLMAALALALCSALSGCGDSHNTALNRQAVVAKYGADVLNVPGERYAFVARKPDGSVWYVETMKTADKGYISAEMLLFAAR